MTQEIEIDVAVDEVMLIVGWVGTARTVKLKGLLNNKQSIVCTLYTIQETIIFIRVLGIVVCLNIFTGSSNNLPCHNIKHVCQLVHHMEEEPILER